eukprot:COSAG05_NODE_11124_length_529_cov_1.283721_2_plen_25_part_01
MLRIVGAVGTSREGEKQREREQEGK